MLVLRRTVLPFINSFFITAALFAIMYSLIYMEEPELLSNETLPPISFGRIPDDTPPTTLISKPTPPKKVEHQPVIEKVTQIIDIDVIGETHWPADYQPPKAGPGNTLPIDNQLVIAIGFPPEYPARALTRGIAGFVIVGFSVSAAGSVIDPYILESEPKGVFDRASIKAISRFKYKARKVNGRPVATDGQRYMFTYKLDQ